MTPAKINSIAAVATPVVGTLVSVFSPQLQHFWSTPTGAVVLSVGTILVGIWNNISTPVHK